MPYYITESNPDCSGWAVEKDDGTVLGCHASKQAAIDQMVAVSLAEGIAPAGERAAGDPPALIVDIDGTLVAGDNALQDVIDFVDDFDGAVFIITARTESERQTTISQLNDLDVDYQQLFMKPQQDDDSVAFKRRIARRLLADYDVTAAIDNDPDMRAMYAELGIMSIDPARLPADRSGGTVTTVRVLPDNYRPALSDDVPTGRACGNCIFYDESDISPEGDRAWCEKWDDYVRGDHYCNAWQAAKDTDDEVDDEDDVDDELRAVQPPAYIRDAAQKGLDYYREGRGGDGLTDGTIREARAMASGTMSDEKVIRANAWGARHEVDLRAPQNSDPDHPDFPGAGAVAHYLWGIDPTDPGPARRWLAREAERIREEGRHMSTTVELRNFDAEPFELRAAGDGMTFSGYAAKYDVPSLPLPFTERIAPGAFTRTLKSRNDVRMYVNHDESMVLASRRAGTLRLEDRADGLFVEADLPPTTIGNDMSVLIRRGDVRTMSFGFSTVKDSWAADGNERTLQEVRLHEVSVVTGTAAYPQTTAAVRNLQLIAARTETNGAMLAEAIAALEAGDQLTDDQAALLRTVVDRAAGVASEPVEPDAIPLSVHQKKLDLLAKLVNA